MQLNLGDKIRELRRRDKKTQEALAQALGVSSQAVSRWETGDRYPDIEFIPALAHYFGITIDELFGYDNQRDQKIEDILHRVDAYHMESRGDDGWVEECLSVLRTGLAEFPQNEKLLIKLAHTLSEAGWRRHHEWLYYDEEGYIQHGYDKHRKNEYWQEAVKICENLLTLTGDSSIITQALSILVLLHRNFGENERAVSYAMRMPPLSDSREVLLAAATDGKDEAMYVGDLLLKMARKFAEQLVYGLICNKKHFDSDLPIEKVKGAIGIFHLLCDDGNMGDYHDDLIQLHLYLSRLQWERGYRDDAFASLDEALHHARALEKWCDGQSHTLTAPLVSFVRCPARDPVSIAHQLPDDWPFWCNPDCTQIAKEIKADPRWAAWVKKTRE